MRANLMRMLEKGEQPSSPGSIGYDDTVIPEIENAVLERPPHRAARRERGQGKTRLIRGLIGLLDPEIPVVAGCEINDDPLQARLRAVSSPRSRRKATRCRWRGCRATRATARSSPRPT